MAVAPKKAILGDLNADLIGTYEVIKKHPEKVASAVHSMPTDEAYYYRLRSQSPKDLGEVERAARFVYLNRHCFNGVYRTNKSGQFNVPRGKKAGSLPSIEEFLSFSQTLAGVKLIAGDFEVPLSQAGAGDFVYLDPPYSHPKTRYRGEYGYGAFCADDIERLIRAVLSADSRGAGILLSYNCTLKDMLPTWARRRLYVRRSVAGFSHQRARVAEMLFTNLPESFGT